MGRIPREFYLSGLYHVYNRGNNRINVFPDSEDKEIFLNLINFYRERFGFKVYAVCLMDNHYHMIVETNRTRRNQPAGKRSTGYPEVIDR